MKKKKAIIKEKSFLLFFIKNILANYVTIYP